MDFQRAGVAYSLLNRNTLFGDEPGLGKTIQSIGFMNLKGVLKVLIVAPTSLCLNWERELDSWHVGLPSIEIYHPKTFHGRCDVLIVSHYWVGKIEVVKDIIKKRGDHELLVIDEFHVFKNKKAQVTKNLFAPNGFISRAKNVHAISGTAMENRPYELYWLLKAIAPEVIGDMSEFTYGMKYCAGWKTPWGRWDFTGASNMKDLGLKLRAACMVRRTKKKVLTQLPDKLINVVYLSRNKKVDGIIKKMDLYEGHVVKGAFTYEFKEMSEARAELGVAKLPESVEYILTQFKAGHKKIIIFAHHKPVIKGLVEALAKYNPLVIDGSTSIEKRDAAVQAFQTNPENHFIILSIRAGGVGLTLTKASYIVKVEFDWKPGLNTQCDDRAHRIGQMNPVVIDYLVYEDSLDLRQLKVVMEKEKNMKEFYGDEE